MSFRLPCICNLKSISVLSGCLSMPDATSLHHCLQNHHQYCIILSWIRALNINRPIINLGCRVYVISFLYSFAGPLQLKEFNFSYLFLRQWCRDVQHQALTGILTEQKLISDCRYRVIESSSLVPVLFREEFSHPYISFFHLLVNVFSVTCFRTFFS